MHVFFFLSSYAQAIADALFSLYVSEEVDKVELIYTKFVSLISSEPTIQVTLWAQYFHHLNDWYIFKPLYFSYEPIAPNLF